MRELFFRRGVIPLANDGILAFGLRALAASATFAYVLISFVLLGTFAYFDEDGESSKAGNGNSDDLEFWSLLGAHIFGAVTCMLLLGTVLEVLRSGFKAVFVCFVQVDSSRSLSTDVVTWLHAYWQGVGGGCWVGFGWIERRAVVL